MTWQDPSRESTPQPYWDGTRWQYPVQGVAPPPPPPVEATRAFAPRRRSHLLPIAIALATLVVIVSVASAAVITVRNRHTGVPSSTPSAQAIFEMPYTKGIRTATFREAGQQGGYEWWGSGVIEFAPEHAFSQTVTTAGGGYERDVEVGGAVYSADSSDAGSQYRATDGEVDAFSFIGWDGNPAPDGLWVAAQTQLNGQKAWVLKQGHTLNKWIVGEETGDPLEVVVDGGDTFRFSDWGRAPVIHAPAAGDISTQRYSGSAGAPVVSPAATVRVLKGEVDPIDSGTDPPGFRTVALEISYQNTTSTATDFDNVPSLVSPDGVFVDSSYTSFQPWLQAGKVGPGQTITGWDGFVVPRHATSFHLLVWNPGNQYWLDYLISISVQVAA